MSDHATELAETHNTSEEFRRIARTFNLAEHKRDFFFHSPQNFLHSAHTLSWKEEETPIEALRHIAGNKTLLQYVRWATTGDIKTVGFFSYRGTGAGDITLSDGWHKLDNNRRAYCYTNKPEEYGGRDRAALVVDEIIRMHGELDHIVMYAGDARLRSSSDKYIFDVLDREKFTLLVCDCRYHCYKHNDTLDASHGVLLPQLCLTPHNNKAIDMLHAYLNYARCGKICQRMNVHPYPIGYPPNWTSHH